MIVVWRKMFALVFVLFLAAFPAIHTHSDLSTDHADYVDVVRDSIESDHFESNPHHDVNFCPLRSLRSSTAPDGLVGRWQKKEAKGNCLAALSDTPKQVEKNGAAAPRGPPTPFV